MTSLTRAFLALLGHLCRLRLLKEPGEVAVTTALCGFLSGTGAKFRCWQEAGSSVRPKKRELHVQHFHMGHRGVVVPELPTAAGCC